MFRLALKTALIRRIKDTKEQDEQCTVRITLRGIRVTTAAAKKAISTHSACVFVVLVTDTQRTCAVLYCHLWPGRLYNIFIHYLINDAIFGGGGGSYRHKMCFDFLYNFV
jgi:hypothetical protein